MQDGATAGNSSLVYEPKAISLLAPACCHQLHACHVRPRPVHMTIVTNNYHSYSHASGPDSPGRSVLLKTPLEGPCFLLDALVSRELSLPTEQASSSTRLKAS